ncbi:hypothetical protein [Flavobacterium sp. N1719]|uniref:hypothetical protein n=1 Tax=Flavobacterium sp. N1719 TaxID=2885633 RepID=UPI00222238A0|nr:hypothetical protein [Flavobacterium sp. N1719]
MRKFIVTLCCAFPFWGIAQNPEIKTELPNIVPPSPTVAALMKFEEVPVSNYTGVPDISFPIYSTTAKDNKLPISISIKYHTGGILADEKAGEMGLGWSLFAGGTISRTSRGLPDEIYVLPGMSTDGSIGIYHDDLTNGHRNQFTYFFDNVLNEYKNYYKPLTSMTQANIDIGNEFLWMVTNKGKFDTEYDLWQFNFMGKSGRFYIKKNAQNQLEIVPLDDYRVKIVNTYSTDSNSRFQPLSFTIYDESGYKYEFDVIETSTNFNATQQTIISGIFTDISSLSLVDSSSLSVERPFSSAFHLSKVYDVNNNLLVELFYDEPKLEGFNQVTITNNYYAESDIFTFNALFGGCLDLPPLKLISNSSTNVNVRKLKTIDIKGKASVTLNRSAERQDTNIRFANTTEKLDEIVVKDLQNTIINRFTFDYTYTTVLDTRMQLGAYHEYGKLNSNPKTTAFSYKINDSQGKEIAKDYWGYFNLINTCSLTTDSYKNPSPEFVTSDVLFKIKYPTGGSVLFDYESHQFSHIGDEPITDFSSNLSTHVYLDIENYIFPITSANAGNNQFNATTRKIESAPYPRRIQLLMTFGDYGNTNFSIGKIINNSFIPLEMINCSETNQSCCIDFYLDANVMYGIRWNNLNTNYNFTDAVAIKFYKINPVNFLYGGGIRIKQIGYFDTDITEVYYEDQLTSPLPTKEKKFNYNFFENSSQTSGALAFPYPLYHYSDKFMTSINVFPYSSLPTYCGENKMEHFFDVYTDFNNRATVKTQGSEVGYKNVTVFESANGKTEFTYTSPIDFPEQEVPTGVPFLPTKNIDFKRGLLLKEEVFTNNNLKLTSTVNNYTFDYHEEITGIRFKKPVGECYTGKLPALTANYGNYKAYVESPNTCVKCANNIFTSTLSLCGLPLDLNKPKILPFPIYETYGWAKLESKETKNYFYDANNTQSEVVTRESFQYNPLNKMIAEHKVINSLGEETKTTYNYLTDPVALAQNRIAEIEEIQVEKEGAPVSQSKIVYSNTFAGNPNVHLPSVIQTAKGGLALENKIRYNRYDTYGNPLEVQQENGMLISYIYGYHNTQVVAKIENLAYTSIPANLITAIQNATDAATYSESAVLSALDALRNDSALANSMVTTVTHIPLVGVSTMTTPNGIRIKYHYDSMNRLEKVTDHEGNIVTENSYNYRP